MATRISGQHIIYLIIISITKGLFYSLKPSVKMCILAARVMGCPDVRLRLGCCCDHCFDLKMCLSKNILLNYKSCKIQKHM